LCLRRLRPQLCFFAHNEAELRQRTAIKVHSGGRRSGRQHFPASAAHGAGARADSSDSSTGSPSVRILHMPSLPFTDGSNDSPEHLDPSGTRALTHLNLAGVGAPVCSVGSTPPQHGAVGVPPQQQSSSVLVLQQQTSVSCAADMMPPLSFDTGLGMQSMQTLSSSMVGTTQCMVPANYVDMPVSCAQMTIQDNSQGLMPAFVIDCGSQGVNWRTGLLAQQPLLQVPVQQLLQLQQSPMMQAPQMQLVCHAEPSLMPSTSFGFSTSQPDSTLQAIDTNSGKQYMLVPVRTGGNNTAVNSSAFQAQQTSGLASTGIVQHSMPAPGPDQPVLLVVNTVQQQ
jgi:hypothetical protein